MRLTSKQDVEAPAAAVFAQLADHAAWERLALHRGAEISRIDGPSGPGPGSEWRARFPFRGRMRDATVRLVRQDPPSHLAFDMATQLYAGTLTVDVFEMSARRSRIHVVIDVKPQTLAARLILQSLRLSRGRVERRFDRRMGRFAAEIEDRLRALRS